MPFVGRKHSEETKAKMRASQAKRPPQSDETRAKISASLMGHTGWNKKDRPPHYQAFAEQMRRAKQRGIPFFLTYEEWLEVWETSGHLHERGKFAGQYVMARPGDVGPYSVDNVKIVPFKENNQEAHKGKRRSDATRKAISDGRRRQIARLHP